MLALKVRYLLAGCYWVMHVSLETKNIIDRFELTLTLKVVFKFCIKFAV